MKNICIFGSGMLGKQLYLNIKQINNVMMYGHQRIDICDRKRLEEIIFKYDYIINCAAYTNVDKAQVQKEKCQRVNYFGVRNLVDLCKQYQKKLIHISTDFVYGDIQDKRQDSQCNPLNFYGQSKLKADNYIQSQLDENNYLILRVSWLFGRFGNNFIQKIKNQILDGKQLNVVDDQIGLPTSCDLVIQVIKKYLNDVIKGGLYNLQCMKNPISKYELSKFILQELQKTNKINPIKTSSFQNCAKRPMYSVLNCNKIDQFIRRPYWEDQIIKYLKK